MDVVCILPDSSKSKVKRIRVAIAGQGSLDVQRDRRHHVDKPRWAYNNDLSEMGKTGIQPAQKLKKWLLWLKTSAMFQP